MLKNKVVNRMFISSLYIQIFWSFHLSLLIGLFLFFFNEPIVLFHYISQLKSILVSLLSPVLVGMVQFQSFLTSVSHSLGHNVFWNRIVRFISKYRKILCRELFALTRSGSSCVDGLIFLIWFLLLMTMSSFISVNFTRTVASVNTCSVFMNGVDKLRQIFRIKWTIKSNYLWKYLLVVKIKQSVYNLK